jgi:WD40 repeat protein
MLDLGVEPLAADVRDGTRHAKQLAVLRILATLLGCRFDDLRQREQERRLRRVMLLTGVMAGAAVLFLVVAIIALVQSDTAKSRQLAVSSSYVLNDDPELSVLLATEAVRVHHTDEAAEALRDGLVGFRLRKILPAAVGGVNRAVFSPNGTRILTAGDDGTVRLWNVETGASLHTIHANGKPVTSVAFSPDGGRFLSASGDYVSKIGESVTRIWDATSGSMLQELKGHTGYILAAEFSHDGRVVITAGSDATAVVWDSASGKAKVTLIGHTDGLTNASFARDDKHAFTASLDGRAVEWDLATGRPLHEYLHIGEAYGLALSADGKLIGTSERGYAQIEKAKDLKHWCEIRGHESDHDVGGLAFSPAGAMLATAGGEGVALVANVGTSPPANGVCPSIALQGHNGAINKVVFTPDGESVITASNDHTARIWEAKTGRLTAQLLGHGGEVRDVSVSSDGKYAATASADGTVRLWQLNSAIPRLTLPGTKGVTAPAQTRVLTWTDKSASLRDIGDGHELFRLNRQDTTISNAVFSTDGSFLVTLDAGGTARIWNAATGGLVHLLESGSAPLAAAAFNHSGDRAAIASTDGSVRVWDVQKGTCIAELRGHTAAVNSVMFSSDGSRLVTASEDSTVRIWDARNGASLLIYRNHSGPVKRATFTANGKRVISASTGDGNSTTRAWNGEPVRIWDSRTGTDVFRLAGHSDVIKDAILSPDGKLVLTTSFDATARTWDPETGINVAQLRGNAAELTGAAFSPDSRFVVTTGGDCSLRVFDARSGRSLLIVGETVGCFDRAEFAADGESVIGQNLQQLAGYPATDFINVFTCEVCISTDRLLVLARGRAKRGLTPSEKARYLR